MASDGYVKNIPTELEEKKDLISCGCCGRRIRPDQASLEIYNTRYKTYEHYHESYVGCYESTRESGKRVVLNRFEPWAAVMLKDAYEEPRGGANIWTE